MKSPHVFVNSYSNVIWYPPGLLYYFNHLLSDDIRCYCNLPICITTSYMCRTAANGGCFSEVKELADDDDLPARHGCMELLGDK